MENKELGLRLVGIGLPLVAVFACLHVEMILLGLPAATVILGLALCIHQD